jgi:hypothetical protein
MLLCRRISATVLLIAIGLVASFSLDWPVSTLRLDRVSLVVSGETLLGLLLIALAWTGTHWTLQGRSSAPGRRSTLPHCILPSAFTSAVWALVALPTDIEARLLGTAVGCVALAWLIASEYYVRYLSGQQRARVQWVVDLAVYVVAMLLFLAISLRISEPATKAAVVALATSALCLRLLADILLPSPAGLEVAPPPAHTGRLSGATGWTCILVLGLLSSLLSWLLDVLLLGPLTYSVVLVVSLYVMAGVVRHRILNRLTRRVALEYLLVGLACFALLLFFTR